MKKGIIIVCSILVLIIVFIGYLKLSDLMLYEKYKYPNEECFGKKTYSEINYKYSKQEKGVANEILKVASEAFSYIGSEKKIPKKFHALEMYCIKKEDFPEVKKEAHSIKLITVKTEGNNGFMWVVYSREALPDGLGSGDILSRWTIKKENGQWIVTDILEAP